MDTPLKAQYVFPFLPDYFLQSNFPGRRESATVTHERAKNMDNEIHYPLAKTIHLFLLRENLRKVQDTI